MFPPPFNWIQTVTRILLPSIHGAGRCLFNFLFLFYLHIVINHHDDNLLSITWLIFCGNPYSMFLYFANFSFHYELKNMSANVTAKNFIPFGAGMTSCAGADFSKVLMGVFFHVMVTKYRLLILTYYLHAFVPHRQVEQNWYFCCIWIMPRLTTIKEGEVIRSPTLGFEGFHVKVSAKHGW